MSLLVNSLHNRLSFKRRSLFLSTGERALQIPSPAEARGAPAGQGEKRERSESEGAKRAQGGQEAGSREVSTYLVLGRSKEDAAASGPHHETICDTLDVQGRGEEDGTRVAAADQSGMTLTLLMRLS